MRRTSQKFGSEDVFAEEEQAKTTLQLSIDDIPDGIIVCDRNGTIRSVNHILQASFGYSAEELVGQKIELLVPERFVRHERLRDGYLESPVSKPMGSVQRIYGRRKDGSELPLEVSLMRLNSGDEIICFLRDVSEHVRLSEENRKSAYFDPVTGALNRRAFKEDLADACAKLGSCSEGICIGLFDLDHFKDVNDTLGHSVGDKLLEAFCNRLLTLMSDGMKLYRIGGDEFAVMMTNCGDQNKTLAVVETAIWHVRKPIAIGPQEFTIRCSAGVVYAPQDGRTPDELISNADLALYEAKRVRGRVSTYSPKLRKAVEKRFALLSEMQTALETGAFELYFQPQIDILSGQITGAEALLRWNHPERGFLRPDQFIDVMSESEISTAIGRWVLFEACKRAQEWQQISGRPIRVAVNLFPRQTYSRSLVNDVMRALTEAGLEPEQLELELTETTILDSAPDFIEILKYLRDVGVRVGLDDFGTGYASLNSLTKYPVDTLKVDKSFVLDVADRPEHQAVLRAMVMLAGELGLSSVAEGVEAVQDALVVKQLGFDLGQGYLWSKPVPNTKFSGLLKKPASLGDDIGIAWGQRRQG